MSNISTAYDAIRTSIGTILPNHVELANPYIVEQEADLNFKMAWGLAFASGVNTNRQLSCMLSIQRDFIFTITRKLFITQRALELRVDTEKELFEDQFLVIKELEKNPSINATSGIAKIAYVSDGGLEFVRAGSTNLIMVQTTMSLEYFENLN